MATALILFPRTGRPVRTAWSRRAGHRSRRRARWSSPNRNEPTGGVPSGADAAALEQSVATPIEQQMSGVDKMLYMYSLNQAAGSQMQLRVDFDVTTDPSVDQVLTNLRYSQAATQLPPDG